MNTAKASPGSRKRFFSPFDFAIFKSDEAIRLEQQAMLEKVYPYFILDEEKNTYWKAKTSDCLQPNASC